MEQYQKMLKEKEMQHKIKKSQKCNKPANPWYSVYIGTCVKNGVYK